MARSDNARGQKNQYLRRSLTALLLISSLPFSFFLVRTENRLLEAERAYEEDTSPSKGRRPEQKALVIENVSVGIENSAIEEIFAEASVGQSRSADHHERQKTSENATNRFAEVNEERRLAYQKKEAIWPEVKDFERQEGVVIATKIHGNEHWEALEQSLCLLKYAYNNRVNYDIVVFSSTPVRDRRIRRIKEMVYPANFTLVSDIPGGLVGHIKSLPPARQKDLLDRCNASAPEELTWRTFCHEGGKQKEMLQYNWQAEFRSLHIWNHGALKPYKWMMWLDTDAFATEVWKQDPIATAIRHDLVLMFDNFPAGASRGDHFAERYKKAFNSNVCKIKLIDGRLKADIASRCKHSVVQQIHGFFHITNLEFYRSPPVMHWAQVLVGNTSFSRMFDDQIAVTVPAAVLEPDRTWDMASNGLKMNVFHNYLIDGKAKRRMGGYRKKFWNVNAEKVFPEAYGKCEIKVSG